MKKFLAPAWAGPLGVALASLVVLLAVASPGAAQPNSRLVLDKWEGDQIAETTDDILFLNKATTDDGRGLDLWSWDSTGRVRFDRSDPWSPSVGYRALWIDLSSDDPRVPKRLTDSALGFGFQAGKYGDWYLGAVLGAGYAGDTPFTDPSAVYGVAYLTATKPVGEHDAWMLSLNYNGNRTLWPDVPIPGLAYHHEEEHWAWTLGLPYSSAKWKPMDRLSFEVGYTPPFTFDAQATYDLTKELSVFARFSNFFEAFQLESKRDNIREFFEQRRAELGVRWVHGKWIDLTVSGGYAFGQEFSRGFDATDLHDSFDVSDEPFVRFVLQGTF